MALEFTKIVKGASAIFQSGGYGFFKLAAETAGGGGGDALVTYGVKIDINNSDPETSVIYTDDAVNFEKSYMDFDNDTFVYGSWQDKYPFNQIKPCILKDGVVTTYLNPNNYAQDINGNPVDITTTCDGDVMIEIPKIYYRLHKDENYQYIQISNVAQDGFCCLAHTYKGVEKDKIYVGVYQGYYDNNTLRSVSGVVPTSSISSVNARSYARAKSQGYELFNWNLNILIQVLYTIQFKNLNCQSALGFGGRDETTAALYSVGNTNTKGLWYGTKTVGSMKVLGIEDMWGNGSVFIDGIISNSTSNGVLLADASQATTEYNDSGTNYIQHLYTRSNTSNIVPTRIVGTSELGFLASDGVNDSNRTNTYYCDWQEKLRSSVPIFIISHQSANTVGIYAISFNSAAKSGWWAGTTRLIYCG